ncbi:unnamed protein product, partial [Ectocarpus sp. 13 AM-2016]
LFVSRRRPSAATTTAASASGEAFGVAFLFLPAGGEEAEEEEPGLAIEAALGKGTIFTSLAVGDAITSLDGDSAPPVASLSFSPSFFVTTLLRGRCRRRAVSTSTLDGTLVSSFSPLPMSSRGLPIQSTPSSSSRAGAFVDGALDSDFFSALDDTSASAVFFATASSLSLPSLGFPLQSKSSSCNRSGTFCTSSSSSCPPGGELSSGFFNFFQNHFGFSASPSPLAGIVSCLSPAVSPPSCPTSPTPPPMAFTLVLVEPFLLSPSAPS